MGIRVQVAIALGACGVGCSDPDPGSARQTVAELPATPNRDLDLLFVIDDSAGMIEAQQNLRNGLPSFLERLEAAPGGLPNLHLGVVTTDMGTKASGSPTPGAAIGQLGQGGCAATGRGGELQTSMATLTDRFLIDVEQAGGGRARNYAGTLAEVLGQMTAAGAGGCGFEQPLAAMRAALDNHPSNAGFLRPEAMLGVIFLVDEDDCSAKSTTLFGPESPALGALDSFRCTRFGVTCQQGGPTSDAMSQVGAKGACEASRSSELIDEIEPYRDFLLGLKPDARHVVVGAILGAPEPVAVELRAPPGGGQPNPALAHSCQWMNAQSVAIANPAVRLDGFVRGFPDRSASETICQQDLSGGLARLGEMLGRALGTGCVAGRIADVDARAEGVQADCVVEDVVGSSATAIASCEASPGERPCWRLAPDAVTCAASPSPNLRLIVERDGAPDPATIARARCRVEP